MELLIDNWKMGQIQKGLATATLRPDYQAVEEGPCTLRNLQTGEELVVQVTRVFRLIYEEVTLAMAQRLGFETLGGMRATLAWVYNLGPQSSVTYAEFTND